MDTYYSFFNSFPISSGKTSRVIDPWYGVLVHDQLGELIFTRLSTR
jgi:hypothetical protein